MRVAIVGTEGSLKSPVASALAVQMNYPLIAPDVDSWVRKTGVDDLGELAPMKVYELLNKIMQQHSKDIEANDMGVFDFTAIEILTYYMVWCSRRCSDELSRNVIKNCLSFVQKSYDRIYYTSLNRDNYEETGSIFGGNLMWEYTLEYIMLGIIDKFNINFWKIDQNEIELAISKIMETFG